VAITKTISFTNWQDVTSGKTRNSIAEKAILDMARVEDLLVEDDGHVFAPVERDGAWGLEPVLTEDEVAKWLRIPFHEARRLLVEASVPVFRIRERMFSPQDLYSDTDLQEKVREYTALHGLPPPEAALELGLKVESYKPLMKNILFHSNDRVLKPLLEAYRNEFLPRNKIWVTRTALLMEFVNNFNCANSDPQIALQFCDEVDCGHVASAQCANPACRDDKPPRFVCPAHEKWVDVTDIRRRPLALCPSCAKKAIAGQLPAFPLL
jgi:hypothetical protein